MLQEDSLCVRTSHNIHRYRIAVPFKFILPRLSSCKRKEYRHSNGSRTVWWLCQWHITKFSSGSARTLTWPIWIFKSLPYYVFTGFLWVHTGFRQSFILCPISHALFLTCASSSASCQEPGASMSGKSLCVLLDSPRFTSGLQLSQVSLLFLYCALKSRT